jgi:hypothetical protein
MVDIKNPADEQAKQTKKLLDSHMVVLKDKLGREPTAIEIADALKDGKDEASNLPQATDVTPENSAEPKILRMKVYYGMGKSDDGKGQKPDPNHVLFYENHTGNTYDTNEGRWLEKRPPVLDHLHQRPLLFDKNNMDIMRAIAHGIIDDEDHAELDKSGALTPDSKNLFSMYKKLKDLEAHKESLAKSEEVETVPDEEAEGEVDFAVDLDSTKDSGTDSDNKNGVPVSGINAVAQIMQSCGVQQKMEAVKSEFGEQGVNLFEQIMTAALSDIHENTRMIIREEIDAYLEPVVDAIQTIAQHIGIPLDVQEPGMDDGEMIEETPEESPDETEETVDEQPEV